MGDTWYSKFVPFTMDEFDRNLYMYCFNSMNPYPRIETNFKPSSDDTVKGNNFLHNYFVRNSASKHKEFKSFFSYQDTWNPIPACKLYTNWKIYPLLK